jgi:ssRNA-specific RNase YbeY (16S rRNA maturation enzyme)
MLPENEKTEAAGLDADLQTIKDAQDLVLSLVAVDRKAREQGHSLVEILVRSAAGAWGINVRPDPVKPDDEG